jgi:addiction module HigA family antidote
MARMHNPPHPGEIIRDQCLEPLGLSVTDAAKGLGVTRKALSELLNGHAGISPEMAIRLEKAFGSTAETWLRMQLEYDLWQTSSAPANSMSPASRPRPPRGFAKARNIPRPQ